MAKITHIVCHSHCCYRPTAWTTPYAQ